MMLTKLCQFSPSLSTRHLRVGSVVGCSDLVGPIGFEPMTFSMSMKRATSAKGGWAFGPNCANRENLFPLLYGLSVVGPIGFEPMTFSMSMKRATNCATGPSGHIFYNQSFDLPTNTCFVISFPQHCILKTMVLLVI